jgi:type IV pilus assembly protein PilN
MIRINLLPVREARRKAEVGSQLAMIALAAGVSVVLAIGLHQIVRAEISGAKKRIAALNQQLADYKPQQAKVDAFKAKKADIQQKLAVIERLERSRSGPVHILDELASRTPDRVWLTELKADDGQIQLEGMSLDNELVALFLTSLNDSPYFTNVELKATELKTVDSLKLNTFKITARLESPDAPGGEVVPAPAPTAKGAKAKPAAGQPARRPVAKEG